MRFFGDVLTMGVLRDPVTAITAGIGLATNVIGGIKGAKTATEASQIQADAARGAGRKIEGTVADTRGAILESARNAGQNQILTAGQAGAGVTSAADRSNALLDPYRVAGEESTEELRRNLVQGGDFNRTPTIGDIQMDPGYAWRIQQAQQAMERGAAARGVVQSGGFLVDLNRKIQGEASNEYQNAFDRYRQNTNDRFSRLSGVSAQGKDAASEQGSNLRGAAQYSGNVALDASRFAGGADIDANRLVADNTINASREAAGYDVDAANAIAAGKVARTNAITGAISGAGNSVTGALRFNQVMRNPTTSYVPGGPGYPSTPSYIPMPGYPGASAVTPPFVPTYPNRLSYGG